MNQKTKRAFLCRCVSAVLAAGLVLGAPTAGMALLHSDIATVKPWNELQINEQYNEFVRNEQTYDVKSTQLEASQIGDAIGSVMAVGVTNKMNRMTHKAELFQILGIADGCALAVRYPGDDRYFVSTNRNYMPATLGNLIEDLNLKENLTFGEISYTYWKNNVRKKGNHVTERYKLEDPSAIWEMLLSDTAIPIDRSLQSLMVSDMDISINLNVIGAENISLGVTMDGYLTTNILDTGKIFFLGKEKTQTFIKYVSENGTRMAQTVAADDGPADGSSLLGAKSVLK